MRLSRGLIGDICAFSACAIWALFPVVMHESFNPFQPIFTAGLSTIAAAILFGAILVISHNTSEVFDRRAWRPILYASILIGVFFYALVFTGARYTSPGNVSLLGLLEILVAFLFLGRKVGTTRQQFFGAMLMMCGALYLLYPGVLKINYGDVLIIAACFFAPHGNFFMKQARSFVSSTTIMFIRSLFAGATLLIMGMLLEGVPTMAEIQAGFIYIFIAGLFLMGVSKILWIESLIRTPIPKATSFASFAPAVTLVASILVLGISPSDSQLISILPMCVGLTIMVSPGLSAK